MIRSALRSGTGRNDSDLDPRLIPNHARYGKHSKIGCPGKPGAKHRRKARQNKIGVSRRGY